MLSSHSFNALLKTLEEPPAHVKFLLATTDPQKLPVTVLSRCLQFSLKNMTPERIAGYLGKVLQAEHIAYEEPALWQLGRAAQGSMRDALSLTDQAIAYGQGHVLEEQVNSMLGTMDRGRLFKLAELMAKADANELLREVASMAEHSPDFDEVLQGLLAIWHRVALAQVVPDAIDNAEGDRDAIMQMAAVMHPEDVQLYYQIGLTGRKDIALAPDPRQGFEMTLLRMLAFRPAPEAPVELDIVPALQKKKPNPAQLDSTAAEQQPAAVVSLQSDDAPSSSSGEADSAEVVSRIAPDAVAQQPFAPTLQSTAHAQPELDASLAKDTQTDTAPVRSDDWSLQDEMPSSTALQSEPESHPIDESVQHDDQNALVNDVPVDSDVPWEVDESITQPSSVVPSALENEASGEVLLEAESAPWEGEALAPHTWWQWCERLRLAGLPLSIMRNSALIAVEGNRYCFDVDPVQGGLFNASLQQKIEEAVREWIPDAVLDMQLQSPRAETPHQRQQRLREEAHFSAKQTIEGDALIQRIVDEFQGVVLDDTVRPISSS